MSHEMHGIAVKRFQEMCQLCGIGMEIGAGRRIRKRMNKKSLTTQMMRQQKKNIAREPQAVDEDDSLRLGDDYGETSNMWLSARRAASASTGATLI